MHIEKFDPFLAQVQELVNQVIDENDIESVKDKKKKLQKTRSAITTLGKEMRDEANAFNKSVLTKEKEIIALIKPEEDKLDAVIEAHKLAKERKEREALLPERKEKLTLIGDGIEISDDAILDMDGTAFMGYMNKRVADKNEKDRLEIVRKQNEIKAQEDAIKRQKEIEDAKEQARIDAEKKAEKDKKDAWEKEQRDKLEGRLNLIKGLGLKLDFSSNSYVLEDFCVPFLDIKTKSDVEFTEMYSGMKTEIANRAEQKRQDKIKADQEAEAKRIAEEQKKDVGHDLLITDLEVLLKMAQDYKFHDFKNDTLATPKVALRQILLDLAQSVVDGKYDNQPR